ncbi:hypothetical protein HDU67_004613 [Dinochytrium kinnereticum]|nr:hypothetical protein HDU67_004613 [Dinochytrium kinnereticum]
MVETNDTSTPTPAPAQNRRRGRNNAGSSEVRGPSSALSRERGIRAPRYHPYSGRVITEETQTQEQEQGSTETANVVAQPTTSTANETDDAVEGSIEVTRPMSSRSTVSKGKRAAPTDEDETPSKKKPAQKKKPDTTKKESAKGKGKGKAAAKKGKGKKDGSDSEDSDANENGLAGFFSNDKIAPRSAFSKRKQKADISDPKIFSADPNHSSVRFCNRCLRRFIPEEDSVMCIACLNIPADGKKGRNTVSIKRRKARVQGDAETSLSVISLRDICIKRRQVDKNTFRLFIGPKEEKIELFDCARGMLQELCLENAAKLSKSAIETMADQCSNLNELSLTQCESIMDDGLKSLRSLSALSTLVLDSLGDIKDDSVIEVLKGVGAGLKTLGLNGFENMEDRVLIDGVASYCRNLEKLMLRGNECLTDEGMVSFFNSLQTKSSLRHLDLSRIVNLKDGSLTTIVSLYGSTIEELYINGLDYLTEYSLKAAFDGGLAKLRDIDISWVRSVDEDMLHLLFSKSPYISTVRLFGCYRLTKFLLMRTHTNAVGDVIKLLGNEYD